MSDIEIIPPKMRTKPPVSRDKCDVFGVEDVYDLIVAGESMTAIAAQIGVHVSILVRWIDDDPQRSARMREARIKSARHWDEKAEQVVREAPNKFELEKARELAHHYRWRAKAIAPRDYGDKVTQEHTGAGGGPIAIASVDLKNLSDAELENMQLLMAKASGASK